MKFLSQAPLPKLTITRTSRKVVATEAETITLYETTTRIEVTLPSLVRGIRKTFTRFTEALASMFLPRVYAY